MTIPRLQALVLAKLDGLRINIELRRSAGLEVARSQVLTGIGKSRMDDIRALVAEMEQDERDLLRQRELANDRTM